eukprot:5603430-Prymnesium_polylepis.1
MWPTLLTLSATAPPAPSGFACLPGHDHYRFCNVSLPVEERLSDLIGRIKDEDKPNMLTARGHGGDGHHLQALPELGVPGYYWGTNCLHSLNGGGCVKDRLNKTRCPTNFPSGPAFGAAFDRSLIRSMAKVVGVELRAMFSLGVGNNPISLDCWGPVVNLNRDPRWGRNGEGGLEDAYAMGELAQAWTSGFQDPRPAKGVAGRTLLQGVMTLKHMAANSLENTAPYDRHNFDAGAAHGIDRFVLADYYLRPFERAIRGADARGIMCSYNAVLWVPTCLSPLIRDARTQWGFRGYVTSDSDSVANAWQDHKFVPDAKSATALALTEGQVRGCELKSWKCDINSGDTYYDNALGAVAARSHNVSMADVDRALANSCDLRMFRTRPHGSGAKSESGATTASPQLIRSVAPSDSHPSERCSRQCASVSTWASSTRQTSMIGPRPRTWARVRVRLSHFERRRRASCCSATTNCCLSRPAAALLCSGLTRAHKRR